MSNGSVMTGFGKALTATILCFIGFTISIVGLVFGMTVSLIHLGETVTVNGVVLTGAELTEYLQMANTLSIVLSVIALIISVICLILGILSIKTFFKEKNNGRKKPIPAFVMGICATAISAFALLFVLISVLFCI